MQAIQRMRTTQRLRQQTAQYRELISIAEEVVACARLALEKRPDARGKDLVSDLAIDRLCKQIDHYCGMADRVIDQTRRRVIEGEQVPNAEKIYSIFEPHTDLIKRGKARSPMEFGHKVFLAESAKGLITQYQVLNGNPPDEQQLSGSLQRHKRAFGRAPELYSADRGFFSERNLALCKSSGVKVVCIPQSGGRRTPRRDCRWSNCTGSYQNSFAIEPPHSRSLVVWQTGTNAAMRHMPLDKFERRLRDGIGLGKSLSSDFVLMSLQYAPAVVALPDEEEYERVTARFARDLGVGLFRRYDIMRSWYKDGMPYRPVRAA